MKKLTLNKHISNVNNMYETLRELVIDSDFNTLDKDFCDNARPANWIQPIFQLQLIQYVSDLIDSAQKQFPLPKLLKMIDGDFHSLAGHNMRSAAVSVYIAAQLKGSQEDQKIAGLGALLHDMGKLVIPKLILDKPSYLTEEEFKVIKTHSVRGYCLLKNETWLPKESLQMVHNHHERIDGSGYPSCLEADSLSIFDRIIAVADVFDAITSKRNYRPSLSYAQALTHIEKECPEKLDAYVFSSLKSVLKEEQFVIFPNLPNKFSLKRMTYAPNHG